MAKLNAAGSALVYSTYLGGSDGDYGNGIAVDSSGNAYVTGETDSTDFPTANPLQASSVGNQQRVCRQDRGFCVNLFPSSLTFGSEPEGTTSPSQSITLTNDNGGSLIINSITTSGDFALFTTSTSCPYTGGTITVGSTCTIDVTFTPTVTGTRTGVVTVNDTAHGSPQS